MTKSTIYISAGHHLKDTGAVANGVQENELTIKLRNLVTKYLTLLGAQYKIDDDHDTLAQYLGKIKPAINDVVCELHFNVANGIASGTEVIVGTDADRLDKALATELALTTSNVLNIPNRGVKSEAESHRGRLGLMREQGLVCLVEVCFIDNKKDLLNFNQKMEMLASNYAQILNKFSTFN
jgi:N-acetylmuramoyl-L-alanine amidase